MLKHVITILLAVSLLGSPAQAQLLLSSAASLNLPKEFLGIIPFNASLNGAASRNFVGASPKWALRAYDGGDELTSLTNKIMPAGTVISSHSYTYDANRNRTQYTRVTGTAPAAVMNLAYGKLVAQS